MLIVRGVSTWRSANKWVVNQNFKIPTANRTNPRINSIGYSDVGKGSCCSSEGNSDSFHSARCPECYVCGRTSTQFHPPPDWKVNRRRIRPKASTRWVLSPSSLCTYRLTNQMPAMKLLLRLFSSLLLWHKRGVAYEFMSN